MSKRDKSAKADYPPTARSRARRLHDYAHYDRATVHAVLDAGVLCHVGYAIEGQPYVTPTAYWRDDEQVFWHGSSASRMLRRLESGVPVCFTVSLLDGLVLARSGFNSSFNYRSVMAFGIAEKVVDATEKERALLAFSERLTPGRWTELRPASAQELKATTVMRMALREVSAKVSSGDPKDEEEDYGFPVWAGVLPVETRIGAPIADPRLLPGIAAPAYLQRFKVG